MRYCDLANQVRSRLIELGINVQPQSRLDQMCAGLGDANWISATNPEFPSALEAIRDLQIINFILDHPPASDCRQRYISTLNDMTNDPVDPLSQPQGGTKGRNLQHELHVAAVCSAAKLKPLLAEPDVVATHEGVKYGFAAKRMKNIDQFEKHCRKASQQICRSGLPGLIVCDMTHAFQTQNQVLPQEAGDSQIDHAHRVQRHRYIDHHYHKFTKWFGKSDVRGIILIEHFLWCRSKANGDFGLSSYTFFVNLCPSDAKKTSEFDSLRRVWGNALPGFVNPSVS